MIAKFLVYCAAFTIFYETFPFSKLGLGSNKPLSLIFIIAFIIINFHLIIKMKFFKRELLMIVSMIILVILSFISSFINRFSFDNNISFLNEVIVFIIIYIFIKVVIQNIKSTEYEKIINIILSGYVFNNIFGVLQFIYIKIIKFDFIFNINNILLNSTNHLKNGRIQFLFGEPSFISLHLIFVILPIYLYCKNNSIKISIFYKFNLVLMLFFSLISTSFRTIVDIFVCISLYLVLFYMNKKKIVKLVSFIMVIILGISISLLFDNEKLNFIEIRISKILNFNNESLEIRDNSIWARKDYSKVGFYSIKDHPLIGYGGGNYIYAYNKNLPLVDPYFNYNAELLRNYDSAEILNAINMYARIFCEFGIVGIMFFLLFVYTLFKRCKSKKNMFFSLMLLYYFIQSDSLVVIPLIFWIGLIYNYKYILRQLSTD